MKRGNLFTVNLDGNGGIDESAFVLRRESAELREAREALDGRLTRLLRGSVRRALLLTFAVWGPLIVGVLLLWRAVTDWIETGAPALPALVAGIVLLAVAGVLFLVRRRLDNEERTEREGEALNCAYGELNARAKAELGVPEDAAETEVLSEMYTEETPLPCEAYTGESVSIFLSEDSLCFFYGSEVIGIPLSSIEELAHVEEEITLDSWNREEPFDGEKYRAYGIVKTEVDQYEERYTLRGYSALRFTHMDTSLELFPPYESAAVEALLDGRK